MIFVDTDVVAETLKKSPDPNVLAWLVRFDAELALGSARFTPEAWTC